MLAKVNPGSPARLAAMALTLCVAGCLTASASPLPIGVPHDNDGNGSAKSFVGNPALATGVGTERSPSFSAVDREHAIAFNASRVADGKLEELQSISFRLAGAAQEAAVDCLAAAGYYEAGDDPEGQRAVMQVVINRLRHPAYPNSVCAVVFEGSQRSTGCQFTFTCDGALNRKIPPAAWQRARKLALLSLQQGADRSVGTATHYHANYVVPDWSLRLDKLATKGAHVFYRLHGRGGSPAAFRANYTDDEFQYRELVALALGSRAFGQSAQPAVQEIVDGVDLSTQMMPQPVQPAARAPLPLPPGTIIVPVGGQSPGRWAVEAMDACASLGDCVVIGYRAPDTLRQARTVAPQDRPMPDFVLVKDQSSGALLPLWDCAQFQRPSVAQCLPLERSALERLLRNRPG